MSIDEFKERKGQLLRDFQNASSYLNKEVFPLDTLWAKCYQKSSFTFDLNASSRGESIHAMISPQLDNSSSLLDVLKVVDNCSQRHNFESSYLRCFDPLKLY
jgi:hypothetical protein